MNPDLFITIAFASLVVTLGLAGLTTARHERRRERATAEQDAAAQEGGGNRSAATAKPRAAAATADELEGRPAPRGGSTPSMRWRLNR